MRFLVCATIPKSGTHHAVLRWGDAPADDLAIQAGSGEMTVPAPSSWQPGHFAAETGLLYDTASQSVSTVTTTAQESAADRAIRLREMIRAALRDTEWTQLPDTALTPAEIAEAAAWRAGLRAIPQTPGWEAGTYDFTHPWTEF
ncbi:MAG: hypothetical protein IAE87_05010 [Rhodobacteraceae bacterium]|jgi:hypothetical protein|nr:hypothetical protein [Paracoccaceae bacterium]